MTYKQQFITLEHAVNKIYFITVLGISACHTSTDLIPIQRRILTYNLEKGTYIYIIVPILSFVFIFFNKKVFII